MGKLPFGKNNLNVSYIAAWKFHKITLFYVIRLKTLALYQTIILRLSLLFLQQVKEFLSKILGNYRLFICFQQNITFY